MSAQNRRCTRSAQARVGKLASSLLEWSAKPQHKDDRLNLLIADALADLILAAVADGFTLEEIAGAIRSGAWNGAEDIRTPASEGHVAANGDGQRFISRLAAHFSQEGA